MEQIIREYILKEFMFDNPQAVLTDDQPLLADGIIDSLGIFTLIAFIEKEFGVKIAPEDVILDNFESVNAIKNLVQSRQASKAVSASGTGFTVR
jgi:acyl carrier protein